MKFFLPYLLIFFATVNIFAQKKKELPDYIFLGADYSTNTQTYGVTNINVRQPNYFFSTNFFSKYDFDLGYAFILTDNTDSTFQYFAYEQNLSIGYTYKFNKKFYLYGSYTHLIHSKNSYSLKSLFSDIAQIDANYDTKYYNVYFTLDHIWGKKNMFYGTFQNALKYEKEHLFRTYDLLNIQLCVALNVSDNNFYNELILDDMSQVELQAFIDDNFGINYGGNGSSTGGNPDSGPNNDLKEWFYNHNKYLFTRDYTLTTIDFSLPVYYSIKKYMFSITPFFSIPTSSTIFYEKYDTFQLMLGAGYFFNLLFK